MFEKEAEEYATRRVLYGTHTWKDEEKAFKDGAEFGYNKGLAEKDIEWHDLRKNPDDLPPKRKPRTEGIVKVPNPQCSVRVLDTLGNRVWFNYRSNKWRKEPFEEIDVIAWCEIPQFKE